MLFSNNDERKSLRESVACLDLKQIEWKRKEKNKGRRAERRKSVLNWCHLATSAFVTISLFSIPTTAGKMMRQNKGCVFDLLTVIL